MEKNVSINKINLNNNIVKGYKRKYNSIFNFHYATIYFCKLIGIYKYTKKIQ